MLRWGGPERTVRDELVKAWGAPPTLQRMPLAAPSRKIPVARPGVRPLARWVPAVSLFSGRTLGGFLPVLAPSPFSEAASCEHERFWLPRLCSRPAHSSGGWRRTAWPDRRAVIGRSG